MKKYPKDIPPSKEEIKEKGKIGWCMQGYIFLREVEGYSHEDARKGAFLTKFVPKLEDGE